jgi:hypothetical protein
VAPLEIKEGTTLGATAQSAIERAAVLYKQRLATFNLLASILKKPLLVNRKAQLLALKPMD